MVIYYSTTQIRLHFVIQFAILPPISPSPLPSLRPQSFLESDSVTREFDHRARSWYEPRWLKVAPYLCEGKAPWGTPQQAWRVLLVLNTTILLCCATTLLHCFPYGGAVGSKWRQASARQRPMAHRGLLGGVVRPRAARSAALAGWGPPAAPASPPWTTLQTAILALSTTSSHNTGASQLNTGTAQPNTGTS
jgi:hypothetical protein